MQIAVYAPTPAPATPTPPPVPTAEPTFEPATVIPIRDPSIGTVPKAIQNVLLPLLIITGVVLLAVCVLLLIATKRRADQNSASNAAYDHLERAKRRDYITPAESEEEDKPAEENAERPKKKAEISPAEQEAQMANRRMVGEPRDEEIDWELPHMKYARDAVDTRGTTEQDDHFRMEHDLYDDDAEDLYQGFERPEDDTADDWQDDDSYGSEDSSDESAYSKDDSYYDESSYDNADPVYGDEAEEEENNPDYFVSFEYAF